MSAMIDCNLHLKWIHSFCFAGRGRAFPEVFAAETRSWWNSRKPRYVRALCHSFVTNGCCIDPHCTPRPGSTPIYWLYGYVPRGYMLYVTRIGERGCYTHVIVNPGGGSEGLTPRALGDRTFEKSWWGWGDFLPLVRIFFPLHLENFFNINWNVLFGIYPVQEPFPGLFALHEFFSSS